MSDETAAAEEAEAEAVAEEAAAGLRYGAAVSESHGDVVLHATVETYLDVCSESHADGFDQLIDLTAVDYLTYAGERTLPGALTNRPFRASSTCGPAASPSSVRRSTCSVSPSPTTPT